MNRLHYVFAEIEVSKGSGVHLVGVVITGTSKLDSALRTRNGCTSVGIMQRHRNSSALKPAAGLQDISFGKHSVSNDHKIVIISGEKKTAVN